MTFYLQPVDDYPSNLALESRTKLFEELDDRMMQNVEEEILPKWRCLEVMPI